MPCSPYPSPGGAFTGSWKPSPGPYPSATSRFAPVPTEHPASFGPNRRVWGLQSPPGLPSPAQLPLLYTYGTRVLLCLFSPSP